jgi:hypothetical protein
MMKGGAGAFDFLQDVGGLGGPDERLVITYDALH